MISIIKGQIISKSLVDVVVLTEGGVGYKVFVKPTAIESYNIGDTVQMLTYLVIRENIMDLYGFASEQERELFMNFIDVSGIGPKGALQLLSLGTVSEITSAISSGDVDYLTKVSGVGKRTAERIVLELRNKVGMDSFVVDAQEKNNNLGDVIDGLVAMGYSAQEAREAVKKLDVKGKSSEELLRMALQKI